MKLRRLIFKFLTLFVLSTGAFFVLSNHDVRAQPGGEFCLSTGNWCRADCDAAYAVDGDAPKRDRCKASCTANQYACYSANAWQSWLQEFDFDITDDTFLIINEPDPMCAFFPEMLLDCGSLPTAGDIEACVMGIQWLQAEFNCPPNK
jgi:hypothetical protein